MGHLAFKLRQLFQESVLKNIEHNGSNLHFGVKRKKACMLHRGKTQRKNYFNSYENPLGKQYFSLNVFLPISFPFWKELLRVFFNIFFFLLTSIHI